MKFAMRVADDLDCMIGYVSVAHQTCKFKLQVVVPVYNCHAHTFCYDKEIKTSTNKIFFQINIGYPNQTCRHNRVYCGSNLY